MCRCCSMNFIRQKNDSYRQPSIANANNVNTKTNTNPNSQVRDNDRTAVCPNPKPIISPIISQSQRAKPKPRQTAARENAQIPKSLCKVLIRNQTNSKERQSNLSPLNKNNVNHRMSTKLYSHQEQKSVTGSERCMRKWREKPSKTLCHSFSA